MAHGPGCSIGKWVWEERSAVAASCFRSRRPECRLQSACRGESAATRIRTSRRRPNPETEAMEREEKAGTWPSGPRRPREYNNRSVADQLAALSGVPRQMIAGTISCPWAACEIRRVETRLSTRTTRRDHPPGARPRLTGQGCHEHERSTTRRCESVGCASRVSAGGPRATEVQGAASKGRKYSTRHRSFQLGLRHPAQRPRPVPPRPISPPVAAPDPGRDLPPLHLPHRDGHRRGR
jgi:hypothetical protein